MKRILWALVCLSSIVRADEGVLIDHVPRGADPAVVIAVVKQALVNHRWEKVAVDGTSVSASISHHPRSVDIRISFVDGRIVYVGEAFSKSPTGPGAPSSIHKISIPPNWIANLRLDIGNMLATIPDVPR